MGYGSSQSNSREAVTRPVFWGRDREALLAMAASRRNARYLTLSRVSRRRWLLSRISARALAGAP